MKPLLLLAVLVTASALAHAQELQRADELPAKQTFRVPDKPRMELVFVIDTTGSMAV